MRIPFAGARLTWFDASVDHAAFRHHVVNLAGVTVADSQKSLYLAYADLAILYGCQRFRVVVLNLLLEQSLEIRLSLFSCQGTV